MYSFLYSRPNAPHHLRMFYKSEDILPSPVFAFPIKVYISCRLTSQIVMAAGVFCFHPSTPCWVAGSSIALALNWIIANKNFLAKQDRHLLVLNIHTKYSDLCIHCPTCAHRPMLHIATHWIILSDECLEGSLCVSFWDLLHSILTYTHFTTQHLFGQCIPLVISLLTYPLSSSFSALRIICLYSLSHFNSYCS